MAGKRVLDAVALFNTSRSVASQHLSIRLKQLDLYNKTSTLAKTVKKQPFSAIQASLSSSLRSEAYAKAAPSRQTYSSSAVSKSEHIPSTDSVQKANGKDNGTEGLEQDHHYRPKDNSVVDDVPGEGLDIQQEKAKRHPLPDGTIPTDEAAVGKPKTVPESFNKRPAAQPAKPLEQHAAPSSSLETEQSHRSSIPAPDTVASDHSGPSSMDARILQRQSESQIPSKAAEPPGKEAPEVKGGPGDSDAELDVRQGRDTFYRAPGRASRVLSALPRVKLPKNTGNVQGGNSPLEQNVNSDVFYSSDTKQEIAQNSRDAGNFSDEMVDQIFHSPRVAGILGSKGKSTSRKPEHLGSTSARQMDSRQSKDVDISRVKDQQPKAETTSDSGAFTPAPWAKKDRDDNAARAGDIAKDTGAPQNVSQDRLFALVPHDADQLTGHSQMRLEGNAPSSSAPYKMRESRVPSSRFGRLWQYGGLAASMAFGAAGESFRRAAGSSAGSDGSLMLSVGNMERLVAKLSKMRGAALKLGQMMSFQGPRIPPAALVGD